MALKDFRPEAFCRASESTTIIVQRVYFLHYSLSPICFISCLCWDTGLDNFTKGVSIKVPDIIHKQEWSVEEAVVFKKGGSYFYEGRQLLL